LTQVGVTPSQTIGPFFARLVEPGQNVVATDGVRLEGTIFDGDGQPVPDAMIEVWDHASAGFGRAATDDAGCYRFDVPKAPYLVVTIFARGLLNHLSTRVYLDGQEDAILRLVPANRRQTLLARRDGDTYRWDVVLQGPPERETVFFLYKR
jgi:protocatechuate 3,4-dioxygenase alpha subunit